MRDSYGADLKVQALALLSFLPSLDHLVRSREHETVEIPLESRLLLGYAAWTVYLVVFGSLSIILQRDDQR